MFFRYLYIEFNPEHFVVTVSFLKHKCPFTVPKCSKSQTESVLLTVLSHNKQKTLLAVILHLYLQPNSCSVSSLKLKKELVDCAFFVSQSVKTVSVSSL